MFALQIGSSFYGPFEDRDAVDAWLKAHDIAASPNLINLLPPDGVQKPETRAEFSAWEERRKSLCRAWSVWEEKLKSEAIPSVDALPEDIAASGKCVFEYPNGLRSVPYDNPTYLNALVELGNQMSLTGDYHHCYLEGVEVDRIERGETKSWQILHLVTGS